MATSNMGGSDPGQANPRGGEPPSTGLWPVSFRMFRQLSSRLLRADWSRQLATGAALCALAIAITIGLGWLTGISAFTTIRPGSPPTPAATSAALGWVSLMILSWPLRKRLLVRLLSLLGFTLLLMMAGASVGAPFPAQALEEAAGAQFHDLWHPSPLTAVPLALGMLAVAWAAWSRPGEKPVLSWTGSLSVVVGFVVLLAHAYESPLLYGGAARPAGFPGALGLFLLGIAMVALAGPRQKPLVWFAGPSVKSQLLRAFVPMALAFVVLDSLLVRLFDSVLIVHPALQDGLAGVILMVGAAAVAAWLARSIGGKVDDAERMRENAECELKQVNQELDHRVKQRTTELERTNESLIERIEECDRLQRQLIEISGREQRRIGQDLHDGLGQVLTGIGFLSRGLECKLGDSDPEAKAVAVKIRDLAIQAVEQSRRIARGLVPVHLEAWGLYVALQALADQTKSIYEIPCVFVTRGTGMDRLPREAQIHVFRIAQEAISNAMKHDQPTCLVIRFSCEDGMFCLAVEHDGGGAPKDPNRNGDGIGMAIMQHRAKAIGGHLEWSSGKGGRLVVSCRFPGKTPRPTRGLEQPMET
jgi:signal transduction histidine kinase